MKSKLALVLIAVCLLGVTLTGCPPPAPPPESVPPPPVGTVPVSTAVVNFPTQLTFNLTAAGDRQITDVRVRYEVVRTSFISVASEAQAQFTPGTPVTAGYTLDMRRIAGLPPGTVVRYRWLVTDAGGKVTTTETNEVRWDDARYTWRQISEGPITLYWYEGDEAFADAMLAAAESALPRLSQDTGTLLSKPVSIYLYNGSGDLQGAMIFPNEWTGGSAYPDYGTITLGVSPVNLDWGKMTVAHELTHLVVHQLTRNPYLGVPVWLDEGLAMYAEGPLDTQFTSVLDPAVAADKLFTVRTLASPFSAFPDQAVLAYAQSDSIVEYLIGTYGQPKMLELLGVFRQGSGYDDALNKVYGFDMDGLNQRWRDYVRAQYLPAVTAADAGVIPSLAAVQPELVGAAR